MRRINMTLAALCAALTLTAAAATAQTTPSDRTTFVTFSGPVSVPGMTLPAGTYTFRILDSQTDRHIVQIFDKESMKLFTTLLAIPAQRADAGGDPVITFKETASDRPPAVHYWYYAGDKDGNELVYPKAQAMEIARASGEPVMAVDSSGTSIDDYKSGSMSRVTADAQPSTTSSATTASTTSSATTSTTTASTTTADTTTTAQPPAPTTPPPAQPTTTPEPTSVPPPAQPQTTTAPEQPAPAPTTAAPTTTPSVPPPSATDNERPVGTSGSLPRTASELPMVGLIGLLALAGAIAIRVARTA